MADLGGGDSIQHSNHCPILWRVSEMSIVRLATFIQGIHSSSVGLCHISDSRLTSFDTNLLTVRVCVGTKSVV